MNITYYLLLYESSTVCKNVHFYFRSYLTCMKCMFGSCCKVIMSRHMEKFHEFKGKRKHPQRKSIPLKKPLYCVCGYSSSCGNEMGNEPDSNVYRLDFHLFLIVCLLTNRFSPPQPRISFTVNEESRILIRNARLSTRSRCSQPAFHRWWIWTTWSRVRTTLPISGWERLWRTPRRRTTKQNPKGWLLVSRQNWLVFGFRHSKSVV